MPKAAKLIINGDDFGLSTSVNEAVIRAYRQGVLTSASLMVNGDAFDEAVVLARAHPGLDVGIHISLIRGKPVLPSRELNRITDRSGCYFTQPTLTGLRYFLDPKAGVQLKKEAEAQIQKFLAAGLRPTHLDGHLHLHIHPSILAVLLPLARKYAIPAFRLPRENFRINIRLDPRQIPLKVIYALIYRLLCRHAQKGLRSHGLAFPDAFFGLLSSGHMNEAFLAGVIKNLGPGITEIGLHPALHLPPELRPWAPDYDYSGELQALLSPKIKELIRENNIILTGYGIFRTPPGPVPSVNPPVPYSAPGF